MKLLLVSDVESPYIWDHFDPEPFRGVSMILSCGDLARDYLHFLVTMIPAPLFFVPGNHDKVFAQNPPEGCEPLDGRVICCNGLRLAGLGGCKSGHKDTYEYTEEAMRKRIKALSRLIQRQRGLDILVTHVAARKLGDGEDVFHQGFECYVDLLDRFTPQYHIFGHRHQGHNHASTATSYGKTRLINACGYKIIEF